MSDNPLAVVEAYFSAFNSEDARQTARFLSDDFKVISPPPLSDRDKAAFLAAINLLKSALPDIKINLVEIEVVANKVTVTEETIGTFSQPLDLSVFGLPVVPPSGKTVRLPDQRVEFTVVGEKIVQACNITSSEEAGLAGLLKALGVSLNN